MPFTISHAAAIMPFARPLARWRLLSAAVIGSMVPDFGLLLPWAAPPRFETHSALGLLTFCLPVGLLAFWIFQRLIKTPLMEVLPDAAHARWLPWARPADWGSGVQWLLAACGVEFGAVTHLIWDGFTHEGARGVRMVPALDDPSVDIAGHHLVGTRLLQDVSSLVGLGLVLAVLAYSLRRAAPPASLKRSLSVRERGFWVVVYVGVSLVLAALFLVIRRPHMGAGQSLALVIGNYAIAALRGAAAGLVVVSLAIVLRLRAHR